VVCPRKKGPFLLSFASQEEGCPFLAQFLNFLAPAGSFQVKAVCEPCSIIVHNRGPRGALRTVPVSPPRVFPRASLALHRIPSSLPPN
jgi:hypothetical protein